MPDLRNAVQEMFREGNRFANFGNILVRMHVQGFRCHTNTVLEIESPITAICGLNGTGKSTLLQLAAAAYSSSDTTLKPYYISDFLVVGTLDPSPFTDEASVEYRFWQEDRTTKQLTLSRSNETKKWRGYTRRLARHVLFAGIGLYIPKVEQRDFVIRKARQLRVTGQVAVSTIIKQSTCRILGIEYNEMQANTVEHSGHTSTVLSVDRQASRYSEVHMGYGEGRTQFLVTALETLPDRSLILIEEPETSLHPSAQHEFSRYLLDVVQRKHHQILLSTHSEFILEALHSQSRIYLSRTETGIVPLLGLTALQAKSLMAEGYTKALYVLVEDECAREVLTELVRRIDPDFLRSIGIHVAGDKDTLAKTVRALSGTGLSVVAVRDGETQDIPRENIFKLPGTMPPEKELFRSQAVRGFIRDTHGVSMDDFETRLGDVNHHEWFARLAAYICIGEAALLHEVSCEYARSLDENTVSTLVELLKESSRK